MTKKFKFVPGEGFVPAKAYPGRRGVPRSPRADAEKSRKMKLAWKLLKSGQVSSMSEAMREANSQVYGRGYPSGADIDFFPERRGVPHSRRVDAWKSRVMKYAGQLRRKGYSKSRALKAAYRRFPHP